MNSLPILRSLVLGVVVLLAFPAMVWADFKAGEQAFDAGDYAAAMAEWLPLAEDGDMRAQTNLVD